MEKKVTVRRARRIENERTADHGETMKQVIQKVTPSKGRETWRVTSPGTHRTLVTTNTSTRVMDRATVIFAPALRRLADR